MLIKQSYAHSPDGGSVTTFFMRRIIICKPYIVETQFFFSSDFWLWGESAADGNISFCHTGFCILHIIHTIISNFGIWLLDH